MYWLRSRLTPSTCQTWAVADQIFYGLGLRRRELPVVEMHLAGGTVRQGRRLDRGHVEDGCVEVAIEHGGEGHDTDRRNGPQRDSGGNCGPERELNAEGPRHSAPPRRST
jgi:hypothetical protein